MCGRGYLPYPCLLYTSQNRAETLYKVKANHRGGGFSSHFVTRAEMPVTMIRLNLVKGLGPVLQIAEGWTVKLPDAVTETLMERTNPCLLYTSESHLIALAAEESRLNGGKAINMNEWRTKK